MRRSGPIRLVVWGAGVAVGILLGAAAPSAPGVEAPAGAPAPPAAGAAPAAASPVHATIAVVLSRDLPVYRQVADGFKQGLEAVMPCRYADVVLADGDAETFARRVAEARPDLVFAIGPEAAKTVVTRVSGVPVFFTLVSNPVDVGLVGPRPDGSRAVAGVSADVSPVQQFELLRTLLPQARRVAVIYCPQFTEATVSAGEAAAAAQGLRLVRLPVEPYQVDAALRRLEAEPADALWTVADPGVTVPVVWRRVLTYALRARVPVLGNSGPAVRGGALAALGTDAAALGRQSAAAVADIVARRRTAADFHLAYPQRTVLYLNLGVAARLGVAVPENLVAQAEMVQDGVLAVEPTGEAGPPPRPARVLTTGEGAP